MKRARAQYRVASRRAAAIAAAVVFAVLSVPLVFGQYYVGLDLTQCDLGFLCMIQRHFSEHQPLLLSPYFGNGLPILLDVSAQLYYPPRWLFFAFPPDLGASLGVIAHLAAGAAAAAWLARTFRVGPFGAACAGVSFALSGAVVNLMLHGVYVLDALWIPLAWAAARRSRFSVVAIALAMCLLGGEPQAFGVATALAGFEVARSFRAWKRAARAACAVVSGLLIGFLLWASALVEMSLGQRSRALSSVEVLSWSLTPENWPGLIWPSILWRTMQPGILFKQLYFGSVKLDWWQDTSWNNTPYVGLMFFAVLAAALVVKRARVPLIVFFGALIFSLGEATPIFPLLIRVVPGLSIFRYPEKYFPLAVLAAGMAIAVTFQAAARSERHLRVLRRAALVVAALDGVLFIAMQTYARAIDARALAIAGVGAAIESLPKPSELIGQNLLVGVAPIALFLFAATFLARYRARFHALFVIDYLLALPLVLFAGPPLAPERSPLASELGEHPVVCISGAASVRMMELPVDWAGSEWDPAAAKRAGAVSHLDACDGLTNVVPYSPLTPRTVALLTDALDARSSSLPRALGCTHFVGVDAADLQEQTVKTSSVVDPIPDVFVTRAPSLATDENAALRAVHGAATLGQLLAIVDDPGNHLENEAALPDGGGVSAVVASWPTRAHAVVSAQGTGGAVIGLRTVYLYGWTAEQASKPLPVVRVSATQVAAVVADVSRGPITFDYAPPRLFAAIASFLTGLAMLALLIFVEKK